ncbi:MAG: carbonic anhydrase [Bacilli bacterium]|nr:carbonic anhydrase [Bacilli bacterium]
MSHSKNLSADEALSKLLKGNEEYLNSNKFSGDVSNLKREDTFKNGQHPFALVITCSDSRVIPEAIFNQGIGQIFVIRIAGNIVDEYALGSIEYGVEHLGINLVMVLGHTNCGAVGAALEEETPTGPIGSLVKEIRFNIKDEKDPTKASIANVRGSINKIIASKVAGNAKVIGAIYDIDCGKVLTL